VTDIVRFSNTLIVFTKAGFLFTTTVNKLRCILPYAEFQHVGSTAIPGGHLEKLPYCKRTKAESAALP
jgi:hypothetical protein